MKLAATLAATFCLAALSLTGCATDNDGEGGAYLSGMRPAKPSFDDPNGTGLPATPVVTGTMQNRGMINLPDLPGIYAETVKPWFPLPGVCDNCDVTLIRLPKRNDTEIGEIQVVSDGGDPLCKIYLNPDGGLTWDDCGR